MKAEHDVAKGFLPRSLGNIGSCFDELGLAYQGAGEIIENNNGTPEAQGIERENTHRESFHEQISSKRIL